MLKIVNDSKLGSRPVLIKTQGTTKKLDFPSPRKRTFPIENKTETPKFNQCKPRAYNPKLTPDKWNSYSNNWHKSMTRMEPSNHESAVNNLIRND